MQFVTSLAPLHNASSPLYHLSLAPLRPSLNFLKHQNRKHKNTNPKMDQIPASEFFPSNLQYSSHSHCDKASSLPCTPISSPQPAVCKHGKKRTAVAKGIQNTMSKTSMLVNFLPTGTLLTFEMLLPSASGDGTCSHVSTMMIQVLLLLCAGSCFFFHFTDSFRAPDGNVYYGFVTPNGLALFKSGLGIELPKDDRYKMTIADLVHALMSVMVFAAIAFSDHRVTNCLFPGYKQEMDQVMETIPLMVGGVCSTLFLVFPNTRYGVGCMAT